MHTVLVADPFDQIQALQMINLSRLLREANHRVSLISLAKKKSPLDLPNLLEPFLSFNPLGFAQMLFELKPDVLGFFGASALAQIFIKTCPKSKIIFHLNNKPNFIENLVIKKADTLIVSSNSWLKPSQNQILLPNSIEKTASRPSKTIVISGSPSVWRSFTSLLQNLKQLQLEFPDHKICLLDEKQELVGFKRSKVLKLIRAEVISSPEVEIRRQKIAEAKLLVISPIKPMSPLWTESLGLSLASETPTLLSPMQSSMCPIQFSKDYIGEVSFQTLKRILSESPQWTPPPDCSNELLRIYA